MKTVLEKPKEVEPVSSNVTADSVPQNKSKKIILSISIVLVSVGLLVGGFFVVNNWPKLTSPFNKKPNPLKVTFATNDKMASAVINSTGGVVELAGETSKYSLNVPKDAVYQSENVTLQELKSVEGISGASLVAGVKATPDGTQFVAPIDLTVETSATGKLVGFAFDAEGDNFHLFPVNRQGNKVSMKISHFSGYGIINVGDGSYAPPTPQSIQAQAQQLIARIIFEGQNETGDLSQNQLDRIYNLLNAWWKVSVKPNLEKSAGNDELLMPAFDEYLVWLAAAQGLGLDKRFEAEQEYALKTAAKATKGAYEKAGEKCTKNKDATQIAKMTRLSKFAMKWGLNHKEGLNVDDLLERTKRCARFELRLNSTTSFPKFGIAMNASGSVNIGMDDNYNLVGEGTIRQNSLDPQDDFACSYESGTMPTFPAKIVSTKLDVSAKNPKTSVILEFSDVENTLVCKSTLPGVDFTSTSGSDDWLTDYFIIHYGEDYQDPGMFAISDWQIVNQDGIYAKKTVDRDKFIDNGHPELNYTLHENTTYELVHTPQ